MGYEGSWSGMRKYLEKDMLADCLKGRVRYGCTTYVGMDGWRIFEVFIVVLKKRNTLKKSDVKNEFFASDFS